MGLPRNTGRSIKVINRIKLLLGYFKDLVPAGKENSHYSSRNNSPDHQAEVELLLHTRPGKNTFGTQVIHVVALGNCLPHFDGKCDSNHSLRSSW